MKTGSTVHVKRLELKQYLEADPMECIFRAWLCAVGYEGIKVTGWVWVEEIQRGIDSTVRPLVNQQSALLNESEETCEAFQEHVYQLLERNKWRLIREII